MNREYGIARCGLACCLCSEEVRCGGGSVCTGCESGKCAYAPQCENLKCSTERGLKGCYECDELACQKGLLANVKIRAFNTFIRQYGIEHFMNCLEKNEKKDVVYHREGIIGDYDQFKTVEEIVNYILKGAQ
ncbi:MAG: DUF3795 domain-containing protein [Cellulosilyticum sp.]|nr:DUF3795 domain-containing protein [Cellulosilyticum sp.]